MKLYHFWFCPASDRARLALGFKKASYDLVVPDYDDDETFFELGCGRTTPILRWDDHSIDADRAAIFARIDAYYPEPSLLGPLEDTQWRALWDWRVRVDLVLERLYAPIRPAYRGIGDNDNHLASYKASIQARFAMTVEELANDRYAAFAQLDSMTRLKELASYLAAHTFYGRTISAADLLLTADLFPLQILDGVTLPIDLMYYFERVQKYCEVDLRQGLIGG